MSMEIKLVGVREHVEGWDVTLVQEEDGRWAVKARAECGNSCTEVDLVDLLNWLATNRPDILDTARKANNLETK